MLNIDYRALISSADLIYHSPVEKAVEGQPIGNGEMGTFVWTTQNAIHFQLNRCDVFAVNKNHAGRQAGPTDYCGGCASLILDLGGDDKYQRSATRPDVPVASPCHYGLSGRAEQCSRGGTALWAGQSTGVFPLRTEKLCR